MSTKGLKLAIAFRIGLERLSRIAKPVWDYLLLFAFTLLLLWPLCMGRALYWGDIMLYFAPMLRFQQTALQQGHIPLWNPTILGGQPLVGNPQMGVFYPTTPLLYLMPVWLYLNVTTFGHIFLAGAFMNAYLRGWSGDRCARVAGSLIYMGSECLIGRIQFPPMIFSAPYFPLLLMCIDRCLETDKPSCNYAKSSTASPPECLAYHIRRNNQKREHIRLSLVIGLLVLAAHPQMAYLILIVGVLYTMARFWIQDDRKQVDGKRDSVSTKKALLASMRLLSAGILGLMLAAVQVLPAIQVLLESPREKLTPIQANRFYLEPLHLMRLIFPRFWGHPASADFWGGGNAWEPAFFIGWLPLVLISAACLRLRTRRKAQFWIIAAVGGIWLAFGIMGGLYWLAFKTVPGLANFHDPARFLIITTCAFAILTTMGWEVCWKSVQKKLTAVRVLSASSTSFSRIEVQERILRCIGIIGIALPLWWTGKDWNPTIPHEFYSYRSRALPIVASSLSSANKNRYSTPTNQQSANDTTLQRIYLPAHEQFWKHYVTDGYSDYGPVDARHFHAIMDTLMPNLNTASGLEAASGYEPVPLSAPLMMDGLGRAAIKRGEPNFSRLLSVMGAGTLILPEEDRISDPRLAGVNPSLALRNPIMSSDISELFRREREKDLPIQTWRNQDALPRGWIVRHIRRVEGKMRLSAAITATDFHPEQVALLQDAPNVDENTLCNQMEWNVPIENFQNGKKLSTLAASVRFISSHNLNMEVDCGVEPGFLIINAAAFPGWQAEVDNRHILLHRVDGALMGVYLYPGQHSIHLQYKPACYQLGLYVSLLAIGALSVFISYVKIQKEMRPEHSMKSSGAN